MKTIDVLRKMRVFNTHELLSRFAESDRESVAVQYTGYSRQRVASHCAHVFSPRFATDPRSPWYHNGKKAFSGSRASAVPRAKEWASAEYGIDEWAADPTARMSWVPKPVRDRALRAVREFRKANPDQ